MSSTQPYDDEELLKASALPPSKLVEELTRLVSRRRMEKAFSQRFPVE